MASALLLPPAFWFRWRLGCPRVDAAPASRGRLWRLPPAALLPAPARLEGREPWWELSVGWNPDGLALALEVNSGRAPVPLDPDHPELRDGLQLWIDTRDTRDVHRATRHCHRFLVHVSSSRGSTELEVAVEQRKIHRALADAPLEDAGSVLARAGTLKSGWWLDLFVPARCLNGYDPETNSRLGFLYSLNDPVRGDQFLTVGRDFPIGEDPSLWTSLNLLPAEEGAGPTKPARKTGTSRKKKS